MGTVANAKRLTYPMTPAYLLSRASQIRSFNQVATSCLRWLRADLR
ncbi:hypothetical protein RB5266 [Rhodopirellula baltica SH 1]|uniref:Uncharacterized protein n=1 Tax=Rhodopirellula baltica (strain DSM 10527 / NCIMB 13988 / SH1) TaxID=243090 RepID=Q7UGE7_RHOBA|nr:hypothetical protein RB5266 [Rhodopirellula baltica SH 1]